MLLVPLHLGFVLLYLSSGIDPCKLLVSHLFCVMVLVRVFFARLCFQAKVVFRCMALILFGLDRCLQRIHQIRALPAESTVRFGATAEVTIGRCALIDRAV